MLEEVYFASDETRSAVNRCYGFLDGAVKDYIDRRDDWNHGVIVAMSYAIERMIETGMIRYVPAFETIEQEMLSLLRSGQRISAFVLYRKIHPEFSSLTAAYAEFKKLA